MANRNVKRVSVRRNATVTRRPVRTVTRNVTRPIVSADIDAAVLDGVVRLVARTGSWNGSMTDLEVALRKIVRRSVSGWPQNPRGMRASLDRVVTRLRRLGVKSRFGRTNDHSRKRFVEFSR